MEIKRVMMLALTTVLATVGFAGTTKTFTADRLSRSAAVKPGYWHADLAKCRAYATANKVPLIAVWSNGDLCGHCVSFESACTQSAFKTWRKASGCVFFFTSSEDGSYGAANGSAYNWCWGSARKLNQFPFVRIYWPAGGIDTTVVGDTIDGGQGGTTGAKKAVAWFKAKLKNFNPVATDSELPYSIAFNANYPTTVGTEGTMEALDAKYGTAVNLTPNAFTCSNYVFAGWAKTATGTVAYKDGASVKGLSTKSNEVVKLYARWTRMVWGTYWTGIKKTIKPTDYKGTVYTGRSAKPKIPGMTWSSTYGYFTGTPTTAGTYEITFTKGTSSITRTFVVAKDEVELDNVEVADDKSVETDTSTVVDTSIGAVSGDLTSIKVSGLPAGLTYKNGAITGRATTPGTYSVTVSGTSAKTGKTVKTVFSFEVKEGNTILLNGLAHADELWAFAGDDLSYSVAVKVKHTDGSYELVKVTDGTVEVKDEDGQTVDGLALGDGKLTGALAESGSYTVTISTTVDEQDLSLTFTVNALASTEEVAP